MHLPISKASTFGFAAISALVTPINAWWRMGCETTLVEGRVDPIVSPGEIAGHTHVIVGGNGFAPNMDYESTQKSTCTTCTIKGDLSNYWIPKMYYHFANGSFVDVPIAGRTVYYQQRSTYQNKTMVAFPPGFRMTAGNPERRNYNNTVAEQAITHVCLGRSDIPESPGLPPQNCPDGVRAQVYFPSCWNGVDLDSDNHQDHMAYPDSYNGGACPDSHPQPVISVFFEFIFATANFANMWYGNKQPFVYSMGDDTGFGLHGDFINGWDPEILQKGIDQFLGQGQGFNPFDVYSGNIFSAPDVSGADCALPPLVNEQIYGVLPTLPGCNPVSDNPTPTTECSANSGLRLGPVYTDIYTDVTYLGWQYIGCGYDETSARALTGPSFDNATMTVVDCVNVCGSGGYSIAGLEYASQCFCGNSLPATASPTPGVMTGCSQICSGNSSEICGDGNRLSLYTKCTSRSCQNLLFPLIGEIGGGVAAAVINVVAPSTLDIPSKSLIATASVIISPSKTSDSNVMISPATLPVSSSSVATASTAPVSESTPVYAKNSNSSLPIGWKSEGCYLDAIDPRTLSGIQFAWWGQKMTSTGCVTYCNSNEFSIAGTEDGGQCFCGNQLMPSTIQPDSDCNMPCDGDASQMCGGKGTLSIFRSLASLKKRHIYQNRGQHHGWML